MPREGTVEVEARKIEPDHLPELGQRILRLDQIVEFLLQAIGLRLRAADEGADARQDLDLIGAPAECASLPLDIGVEFLGAGERLMCGENRFRNMSGERASIVGGTGLDIDGTTLGWARHVQGAAYTKMFSDMINRVDLAGVGENAGDRIIDESIILPAIPKL